jgi:hypothetical protein
MIAQAAPSSADAPAATAPMPTAQALENLGGKVTVANGRITQLQIDASKFTPADFRMVGQCTTLQKLNISGKTIDDQALVLLAGLENLEELSTNLTMLSDDGYKGFLAFRKLRSLSLFHPSWNDAKFTGAGLAHLKDLPALQRLTFAGSTAGDAAMEAIGQLTQLTDFSTWHTAQTQAGNEHLLKLTKLRSLRIGQRLPRGGAKSPASFDASTIPLIARIKTLQKLELFEARLTAADLMPLKDLPELKQLSIHTTDISPADVETVRATLKSVKLEYKPLTPEDREATLTKKLKI